MSDEAHQVRIKTEDGIVVGMCSCGWGARYTFAANAPTIATDRDRLKRLCVEHVAEAR